MTDTQVKQRAAADSSPTNDASVAETRFDPPHRSEDSPAGAEPTKVDADTTAAAESADDFPDDPILAQAAELAEHLRNKQRDLDRRESQLNARSFQLENEMRTSRLWFSERQAELSDRERELAERAACVEQQAASLAAAEVSTQKEWTESQNKLAKWEEELDGQRLQLEQEGEALAEQRRQFAADSASLEQRQRQFEEEIESSTALLHERELRIEANEKLLEEHSAQIEADREKLAASRDELDQHVVEQRKAIRQEREAAEAELASKRRMLAKRGDSLQQREAALEKMQADVHRIHRESLELRLVSEQLWSQLCAQIPPERVTQSLAAIRRDLADQFRLEQSDVARQVEDLRALGTRLDQRQQELQDQRDRQ